MLNGTMPDLLEKHFEGERDIPADKVKDLLTKGSREAVIEALTKPESVSRWRAGRRRPV